MRVVAASKAPALVVALISVGLRRVLEIELHPLVVYANYTVLLSNNVDTVDANEAMPTGKVRSMLAGFAGAVALFSDATKCRGTLN